MARKTLEDFDYDYQAYADYLESAECANDEGYSVYGDQYGNVYKAIDGDWTKGHSHTRPNSDWEGRGLDNPDSKGRPWKNRWLKYAEKLNLTSEDIEFLIALYDYKQNNQINEPEEKTINNKILSLKDIEKILELLVIQKCLNKYILNINVQQMRSNNLASYSNYMKEITIYTEMIEQMVKEVESNILIANNFEIVLYKNLSILQVLLHEVEHANQQKIAYNDNTLEALIIRLSFLVNNSYDDYLYEFCPEERLAEIKSFEEIGKLICYINKKLTYLPNIIEMEELKRNLRGYHYKNGSVTIPIVDYFNNCCNQRIFDVFDLTHNVINNYSLKDRFKYGLPISIDEYGNSLNKLVLSLKKNFNNRINIIK